MQFLDTSFCFSLCDCSAGDPAANWVFEFVIVFLIGGLIILGTVGNDRSVTNAPPPFSRLG
jgi:hypothetical protein